VLVVPYRSLAVSVSPSHLQAAHVTAVVGLHCRIVCTRRSVRIHSRVPGVGGEPAARTKVSGEIGIDYPDRQSCHTLKLLLAAGSHRAVRSSGRMHAVEGTWTSAMHIAELSQAQVH
jgi:hypothetical protein